MGSNGTCLAWFGGRGGGGGGGWSWCFLYVCSVCACFDLSVSSSSWGLGRAAVCDCGTPWTFLLPFFDCPQTQAKNNNGLNFINYLIKVKAFSMSLLLSIETMFLHYGILTRPV